LLVMTSSMSASNGCGLTVKNVDEVRTIGLS
jgi:hypothetical protein